VQPTPTLARHTGLSCGASDSVRCARLADGEPTALGKTQRRTAIIHRTVRWCTGLSGEPTVANANGRPRDLLTTRGPQQRSVGYTGLSGVHDPEDQRSDAPDMEGDRAPDSYSDCPVHHPTEGKFGLSCWPPTAPSCLGAIKETPRRMEKKPKLTRNILRHLDSSFMQLDHRSLYLSTIRVVNSSRCVCVLTFSLVCVVVLQI
jgi:hypothetical protein